MTSPKVSVIVPVYNAASTLARSVHSLLRQDLQSLEMILVDDASTDHSATVMQALAEDDARIKTIFKTKNGGVHEARRSGLEVATGRWIGFMDADDYVEPEMFSNLLAAGEANDSDIVLCSVDRVTPSGERQGIKFRFREEQNLSDQVFERFCRHEFGTGSLWNKLYRRELIMEHGSRQFLWRQDINEDTIINIGCFLNARTITTLPSIYYHYSVHPDSASANPDKAKALTDMLRAYALAIELYRYHGLETMKGIDILYRNQLSYPCYYLKDTSALYDYSERLSEAIKIIAAHHPVGVGVMVSYLSRPCRQYQASLKEQWAEWRLSTITLFSFLKSALLRRLSSTHEGI